MRMMARSIECSFMDGKMEVEHSGGTVNGVEPENLPLVTGDQAIGGDLKIDLLFAPEISRSEIKMQRCRVPGKRPWFRLAASDIFEANNMPLGQICRRVDRQGQIGWPDNNPWCRGLKHRAQPVGFTEQLVVAFGGGEKEINPLSRCQATRQIKLNGLFDLFTIGYGDQLLSVGSGSTR